MSDLPPWVRSSTEPRRDELARFSDPTDPEALRRVREATAPSAAEVARLLARAPAPRRGFSPLWAGAPLLLAVSLLLVRSVLPTATTGAPPADPEGVHVVRVDLPWEVVPGVRVEGRGTASVDADRVVLDGILRVHVWAPVTLEIGGRPFTTRDAELHVAGDAVAVVAGAVRAPDGRFLVSGDRWAPETTVATAPLPAAPASRAAPRAEGAPTRPPAPEAVVVAPVAPPAPEAAVAAPVDPPSGTPPDAVVAWADLLDQHEAGLDGARFARALDGYRAQYPHSPFAGEAVDLAALASVSFAPAADALARLEEALALRAGGPRTLELHTAAAWLAREERKDCAAAAPHDRFVAANASGRARATAEVFLALCALRESGSDPARAAAAREALRAIDTRILDAALAAAVERARTDPGHEGATP